uniref:Resolvase n=1 Tax=Klebsiella pneumoniae TaxID=573 RepID=A0A2P1BNE5_KLEPN|nr:hypothetical protein [Klebsiella pneumoniae]
MILIEQVDRLTRLDDAGWETLRKQITDKQLAIVSLDLPTSHLALSSTVSDDFAKHAEGRKWNAAGYAGRYCPKRLRRSSTSSVRGNQ